MANKQRGYVAIELDKPRSLRFTTNALAELEDALGRPLSEIGGMAGIKTIRTMVWAGLLHEEPGLTHEQASELIDYSDLTTVSNKAKEALELAFASATKKKKKTSAQNGTGQN
jgi:hypothetical protein